MSPHSSSGRVQGHPGLAAVVPEHLRPFPCLRHQEDPKELGSIWRVCRDDIIVHERFFASPSPVCLCRENRADGILARRTLTRFPPHKNELEYGFPRGRAIGYPSTVPPPLAAMRPSAPTKAALATPASATPLRITAHKRATMTEGVENFYCGPSLVSRN